MLYEQAVPDGLPVYDAAQPVVEAPMQRPFVRVPWAQAEFGMLYEQDVPDGLPEYELAQPVVDAL
jgi:hypothetical protein